jgi:tripartite-type tricarboxylate transporter receptor subunit TctC
MNGAARVARAEPDGYTFGVGNQGTHIFSQFLYKKPLYNPETDFAPIGLVVGNSKVLVVRKDLPVDNMKEFVDYARKNEAKMQYGSGGGGSATHVACVLLTSKIGAPKITHVPYRGVAPAMQDVIGGHIPMVFISVSNAMAGVKQGSVKILAVLEPERYAKLPQVPSMSESVPAFRKPSSWFGFFGPAKLPPEIVSRLGTEMRKAIQDPDVRAKLEAADFAVIGDTPEQFAELLKDGIKRYGAIIKAAGIPAQ